ncbi:MAG: hypothetical protein JWM86_2966 [Thermoleophilia bacterium]|nr:hypothetical protein [Thermoleophilia bacterium]
MDVTLVTCTQMPEPDPDEQLLLDALGDVGVDARLCAWDDPAVDWGAAPLTVLRSTWNYTDDRDAFLAWTRRIAATRTTMRNPLGVIGANTHKSYLATLERAEVPVVPTRWFARGGKAADAEALRTLPWRRVIAKPAVGAGSRGVAAFDLEVEDEFAAAVAHLTELQARDDVLMQPQLESIRTEGELDIVWIDGEFTHAVTKLQRLASDDEHVTRAREVTEPELKIATRALRTVEAFHQRELLYARVDVAADELGDLRVVELELTEPSLFLAEHPPALKRFVAAIRRESGAVPDRIHPSQ